MAVPREGTQAGEWRVWSSQGQAGWEAGEVDSTVSCGTSGGGQGNDGARGLQAKLGPGSPCQQ